MNHPISQISSFESCNAGIPKSLVRSVCLETITESWQDNPALASAFQKVELDLSAELESINQSLQQAACETRATEADLKQALTDWLEIRKLAGYDDQDDE